MKGRHDRALLDRGLLTRAFGVLGATEALMALGAFTAVLVTGGWRWGESPDGDLLAVASGTAFATISLCQMANAFACRSESRPVWRLALAGNPSVLAAVAAEVVLLVVFLGVPLFSTTLGGGWPSALGWAMAAAGALTLVAADGLAKGWVARGRRPRRMS
jgi:magnesium-transporting ATPase (P-type)